MGRIEKEIYNQIVIADIGDMVCTKAANKMEYKGIIEDMLTQQGYKQGVNYESIFDWGTAITHIKKLTDIKPYTEPQHNIKVGEIVYNSWGYDQTNIDFYQVTATTAKTITLRAIQSKTTEFNNMQLYGKKTAIKDCFTSDKNIKKTPHLCSGKWYVNFEYGAGRLWDGEPIDYSCYA